MERKAFIQMVTASIAAGTLVSLIESCSKTGTGAPSANFTLDLTQSANSPLKTNGGSVISNNVMVINNNGTYVALSDICTHAGCALAYDKANKQLDCYCHGSVFSITGAVLGGPAPTPLQSYTVTKNGNTLTITG